MAPNPKRTEYLTDEIDLLLFAEHGIAFLKKYRWLFIIAALLGISWGLWRSANTPAKYSASMLVRPSVLTNQENIELIDQWDALLHKKEYAVLSQTLNCPVEILRQVFQIRATEIQKVFTPTNPNGFSIDVQVRTNDILPTLQQAILWGLENSGYVPQKTAAKKNRLSGLIGKTATDIDQLDSTKKVMAAILRGHGNSSSSLILDGSTVDRQWIDMNEKLAYLKEELQFTSAVQLLQGFQPFQKPTGNAAYLLVAIGLFVGLLMAFLFAQLREINSRLRMRAAFRKQNNL